MEGVRTRRWKYTASPTPAELYDVLADPHEHSNRAAMEPAVLADLQAHLVAMRGRTAPAPAEARTLGLEERERLAALGYVDAPAASPDATAGTALDPRRLASVRDAVDEARSFAAAGRWDDAIESLETLAQSASVEALALRTLAPIYAERGRFDAAAVAYRRYLKLTGSEEAALGLARALLLAGQPAEAFDALAGIGERSPAIGALRAHALARLGRMDDAFAAIDAAYDGLGDETGRLHRRATLVIDVAPVPGGESELRALFARAPDDAILESWLGYYLVLWGTAAQHDEAYAHLAAAAHGHRDDPDLQANLGWGAARLGRDAEAREALEAALALDPGRSLERYRLAVVLRRAGDTERAAALVRTALAERPGAPWAESARTLLRQLAPQEQP